MTSLVMKFGGTSVGSTEAIKQTGAIILKQAQVGKAGHVARPCEATKR